MKTKIKKYWGKASFHISEYNYLIGDVWQEGNKKFVACNTQVWHGYEGAVGVTVYQFEVFDYPSGWKIFNTYSDTALDLFGNSIIITDEINYKAIEDNPFISGSWNLILLLLLILSSYNSNAQLTIDETKKSYPVVGFSAGYSLTHKVLNAGLQFGYRVDQVYLSGDMIIPLSSNSFVPKIIAANMGVNLGQFQPFISTSYQSIGAESEQYYKGTPNEFMSGFRFGYGIRYYPKTFPLSFTIQQQGKEFIVSLSIYKVL